jgi:hypothetical protein
MTIHGVFESVVSRQGGLGRCAAGYRDDVAEADEWFQKVIDTGKAKASRKP